jgi:uncharacterized protein (DUF433 family)
MDVREPLAEIDPLIVEDADIQDGAPTFRGTRLLVHHIASLLDQGATEMELREDYPRLTQEMLDVAPAYARAHPHTGVSRNAAPDKRPRGA